MPRSISKIADIFAQVLEEQGFEKQAYPFTEEWTEQGRDQSNVALKDTDPLYNLHHEDEGYKADENIAHLAHPEPVIIFPSYDRINGLVENINERSSIMQNLALDHPVGLFALNKYATRELTMELIRVANEMDAANQEDLFKLADACLLQIEGSKLKKKAALPLIPIVLVAAAIGAVWLANNTDGTSKGVFNDCDHAIEALKSVEKIGMLEGEIDEFLKATIDTAIVKISDFKVAAQKYYKIIDDYKLPRTADSAAQFIQWLKENSGEGSVIKKTYDDFRANVYQLNTYLTDLKSNLESDSYVKQHKQTTRLEEWTGFLGDLVSGNKGLFSNDFAKAAHALSRLHDSMDKLVTEALTSEKMVEEKTATLQKAQDDLKPKASSPAPSSTPSAPQPQTSQEDEDALRAAMRA